MKRKIPILVSMLALLVISCLLLPAGALAKPTTPEQAQRVVKNWLSLEDQPLDTRLGREVMEVKTFADAAGRPLYYVVYLDPAGMVFVPGDDLVEPIAGFAPEGEFIPSDDNPLGALVTRDLPGRVTWVRQLEDEARAVGQEFVPRGRMQKAQGKWQWLEQGASSQLLDLGLSSISDVRVSPLTQTTWDQTTAGGSACYNYYTPKFGAGNASNYPCGCVATAMSQLMRFWQYPTTGVGTAGFTITVDNVPQTENLMGGDGAGGPYVWANMPLNPGAGTTTAQRQAIGRLTHDAGVSVGMSYAPGGSGTDTLLAATAFKNVFHYSNAVKGFNGGSNLPSTNLYNMVNPNLDAGFPVLFGITGSSGGHAIVGDGYGYNASTMYHHLNMGWSGANTLWYNLPNIDSNPSFTSVYKCIYNVYTSGSGEIISGRVTDGSGNPVNGAAVTATRTGGGTYNATTNAKGIYALAKIPGSSSYTVAVTGYTSQSVNTGASTDNSTTVGNLWGVNFGGAPPPSGPEIGVDFLYTAKKGLKYTKKGVKLPAPAAIFKRGKAVWFVGHVQDNDTYEGIPNAYVDIEIYDDYNNLAAYGTLGPTDYYGLFQGYWQTSKYDQYPGYYWAYVTYVDPPDPSMTWDGVYTEWVFFLN